MGVGSYLEPRRPRAERTLDNGLTWAAAGAQTTIKVATGDVGLGPLHRKVYQQHMRVVSA